MKKLKFIFLLAVSCLAIKSNAQGGQLFVNREWQDVSGNPFFNPILNQFGVQWSNSIHSAGGGIITVGHSTSSAQGENIYLIKYNAAGGVVFSITYNTSGTNNDYGIGVVENTSNGNIYVVGTTDNGGSTNYDAVILRYNSTGSLLNSTTYAGSSGLNDIGIAIKIHPTSGAIIVALSNENSSTSYDYRVLKLNATTLALQASNTYDYANLTEVPTGIEFSSSNDICLIGASANSITKWDYCMAVFNPTSLAFQSSTRSNITGIGFDQPTAFCKDGGGNIYITGRSSTNGINYDIRTIKILSNLTTISWNVVYDGYGLEDCGNSISVDNSGDVIVGGFSTKATNKKELVCRKYGGSSGTLIWQHTQTSTNSLGDAFIKKLDVNLSNGSVYYVAGELGKSGYQQSLVGRISTNGLPIWQKIISDSTKNIQPSDLKIASDGIYVISVKDPTLATYQTTKYSELELDSSVIRNSSGVPVCVANQLIVRFQPSALDSSFIDNAIGTRVASFGDLQDFMKPLAYSQFTVALMDRCPECKVKAVKVFPGLSTTYTSSISRLGTTVPIPDFWTTLLLEFPSAIPIQQVYNSLKGLPNIVAYSHPNFLASVTASPTNTLSTYSSAIDPVYQFQASLHPVGTYTNAHINVEEAWQILPEGGYPFIKVGVFDTGLNWTHPDFNYFQNNLYGNKTEGWDFQTSQSIKNLADGGDYQAHGTGVAGIIGAIRNNTIAIKGIAGGNDSLSQNPNTGVSIYGLKIIDSQPFMSAFNYISDAIISSALYNNNSAIAYDYGLHIQNHSWSMPDSLLPWYVDSNLVLLTEAIHYINRLNVTFVASRGNVGKNTQGYPGAVDDDWVLLVGGNAANGNWADSASTGGYYQSNWGRGVDITAPSEPATIRSTTTYTFSTDGITALGMTSAAAPHVSGVVALLMSYYNDSTTTFNYNNLAPEDCEQIIQRSASPMANAVPLPNQYCGYGRLNAGKALRLIEKPCNKISHFGTSHSVPYQISKTVYSSADTIVFTERCQDLSSPSNYLPKGKYIVKTYQIDATITHSIPSTDTIKAYWPRPSGSDVWELFKNKKLRPRQRDTIISCTNSQAHLRGYIYQVRDTLGTLIGWWPCDTTLTCANSNSLFEYSVLTKSCNISITGIHSENNVDSGVSIYPNPANTSHVIEIESEKVSSLTVDLYDIMGKFIRRTYTGKTNPGNTYINCDVSSLPNSLYIYIIKIDNQIVSKKFVKSN